MFGSSHKKQIQWRSLLYIGVPALCMFAASCPMRADDLPHAEELFAKYVEVTGGKEAYAKLKNRISTGTMNFQSAGVKGKLTIYEAAPDKLYSEAAFPRLGKSEEGCDGKIAWERSAAIGAVVKTGNERAIALRKAVFNNELDWRNIYTKLKCVGEEKVDDTPCYKVEATTPYSQIHTRFYDKKTNLLVKIIAVKKNAGAEVSIEKYMSDYKRVDGVLLPHRLRFDSPPLRVEIIFDKIVHNVKLPNDRFIPPPEIKNGRQS